jgi:RNA 3'-terminal phosphate cyclase (ATP)
VIELDGSDGGGQLLRTALSLSGLTGRAFEMTGVRANRPTPGVRPQHLACVEAAATLTDATVEGDDPGSETIAFTPNRRPAGDATVAVGTAGSVALVFDTIIPFAAGIDDPVSVTASGGTDVEWAPTFDFLRRVKLPLLARSGLAADVVLHRRGFYPVGGGRASLHLAPSSLRPLSVERRGAPVASVHAVAATALAEADVCERALDRVRSRLAPPVVEPPADESAEPSARSTLSLAETTAAYAETDCPGFALLVVLADGTRAGFDALGERGVPAEDVADEAVDAAHAWLDGPGVVDPHLADQLVVPLALAGGRVRVPRLTAHVRTNREMIEAFGDELELDVRDDDAGGVVLSGDGTRGGRVRGQGA